MDKSLRPRLAFVVAAPTTAQAFLKDHMRALSADYDVALIADTDDEQFLKSLGVNGSTYPIALARKISPLRDLAALIALTQLFRTKKFDAVHSVTPKAGLLSMTAARIAGVEIRTHTFTGQVWATRTGGARWLLKQADRFIAAMSSFALVDSESQRQFLIRNGVLKPADSSVLADGSICGVDTNRFRPDAPTRLEVRNQLNLADDDVALLFVGRLTRDKGLTDLAQAFADIAPSQPNAKLIIVGPDEDGVAGDMRTLLGAHVGAARFVSFTPAPERFMAACDILCLPSYREGFGSVVIEAAAAGLPALASRIYGLTDAVEEGVTGLLHEPRDLEEIKTLMSLLVSDEVLRAKLGKQAQTRARALFSSVKVVQSMRDFYATRFNARAFGDLIESRRIPETGGF